MDDGDRARSRKLTAAEKTLLPAALARDVDLDKVTIVRRWHTPIAALLKVTVVRGTRIFWAHAPDEARTLGERAHLAHELVHVWQYEALGRTGVEIFLHRRYRYRFDPERSFFSYGFEQQASIVEDFVRLSENSAPRRCIGSSPSRECFARLLDCDDAQAVT